MKQEVSSKATAFYRWGIPVILLGLFCIGLLASVERKGSSSQLALGAAAFGAVAALVLFRCWNLKEVWADDHSFYISDGKREARIPFEQVESVFQRFWQRGNPDTVAITFASDTAFGRKIVFAAPFRVATFTEHPIVDELNGLISRRGRTAYRP